MAKPPGPARSIRAVPRFVKSKRRLPDTAQEEVDAQVRRLIENPLSGEPKVGALKGVRVVKFKVGVHQYLLAYQFLSSKVKTFTLSKLRAATMKQLPCERD